MPDHLWIWAEASDAGEVILWLDKTEGVPEGFPEVEIPADAQLTHYTALQWRAVRLFDVDDPNNPTPRPFLSLPREAWEACVVRYLKATGREVSDA